MKNNSSEEFYLTATKSSSVTREGHFTRLKLSLEDIYSISTKFPLSFVYFILQMQPCNHKPSRLTIKNLKKLPFMSTIRVSNA